MTDATAYLIASELVVALIAHARAIANAMSGNEEPFAELIRDMRAQGLRLADTGKRMVPDVDEEEGRQ